jgi:mitochondrial fission protein ELM1
MKVWLIDEGTPGHTVQTAGLGGLLLGRPGVDTEWITCRLRLRGWMRPLARWLVNRVSGGKALIVARLLYPNLGLSDIHRRDLVVSSCGKSAYLNRLLCKASGARGVFIGEIDPFPAAWFDLIVTPVESGRANELLAPVIETGRTRENGRAAMETRWGANVPTACWTLLAGGNSRTHPFDPSDWDSLAAGMIALARRHSIRWLITTSRRTGLEAEERLRKILPPEILAEAVWYSEKPEKVVGAFLAAGERIFVTQDSLTMMSECLATGKRTELLRPRRWNMPGTSFNGRYVARLAAADLVGRTDLEGFANFTPTGDGRVNIDRLREDFAERLLAWIDKGGAAG